MFQQAIDFVLKGVNGAVDVLTDLNTVAPIIGIALVSFLILTVVSRLILPIIGGTLPSGMADSVDDYMEPYRLEAKQKREARRISRKTNYAVRKGIRQHKRDSKKQG